LVIIPLWPAQAQQKYALVIGNGAYTNIPRLNNPVNDANDMAAALQGLGFQVDTVLNGSLDQMENAVIRLKNRLSTDAASYGFFFYAGHGVQSNGENYLIPADANIASDSFLRQRAVQMQAVLEELNQAGNALNIVVLDACRDNPFSWARSGSRCLNVVGSQPADSIIVYATSAGSIAADGTGRNGLFTGQLLNNLKTPGLEVKELFNRTGADVRRVSGGKQVPAIYSQFFGAAYLAGTTPVNPRPAAAVVTAPQAPRNVRAGTPGADRVTLSWDGAGSGIDYKVYYHTQDDPSGAFALNNTVTGTSTNITGLLSGSTYYFWVTALKDGQESGKSPAVTVRTAASRPAQAENRDLLLTLSGHSSFHIFSAAFSPDGRRIVSGSMDKTVKVWNAETGALIRTLSGHTGGVKSAAFSPDGRRIVSGADDQTVKVWDAGE
jgi:hypothetical protein